MGSARLAAVPSLRVGASGTGHQSQNCTRCVWGEAVGAGLYLRYLLLQFLPGSQILSILKRIAVLCTVGIAIYLAVARLLGVTELARLQRLLSRKLLRSR